MNRDELIRLIKQKKELREVADSFVNKVIDSYVKKHPMPRDASPKAYKLVMKDIRSELRLAVGRFQKGANKSVALADHHLSTHERAEHYTWLKEEVARHHPRSILDLGCGLNPLILATSSMTYYACDINERDVTAINDHFKKNKISGKAFVADVTTYTDFPAVDLVLALKLFDILDVKGRATVERLITTLSYTTLIASFPTRKISGRRMEKPHRVWLEKMLVRLNYPFTKVEQENELFYIVSKS